MSLNMFFLVSGPSPSSYRPLTIDTPAEPPSRSSSLASSSWSRASILPCIPAGGVASVDWDVAMVDVAVTFAVGIAVASVSLLVLEDVMEAECL